MTRVQRHRQIAGVLFLICVSPVIGQVAKELVLDISRDELQTPVLNLIGSASEYTVDDVPWLGLRYRASKYESLDRWSPDIEIELIYVGPGTPFSLEDQLSIHSSTRAIKMDGSSIEISRYSDDYLRRVLKIREPWTTLETIVVYGGGKVVLGDLEFEFNADALAACSAIVDELKAKLDESQRSYWRE